MPFLEVVSKPLLFIIQPHPILSILFAIAQRFPHRQAAQHPGLSCPVRLNAVKSLNGFDLQNRIKKRLAICD